MVPPVYLLNYRVSQEVKSIGKWRICLVKYFLTATNHCTLLQIIASLLLDRNSILPVFVLCAECTLAFTKGFI